MRLLLSYISDVHISYGPPGDFRTFFQHLTYSITFKWLECVTEFISSLFSLQVLKYSRVQKVFSKPPGEAYTIGELFKEKNLKSLSARFIQTPPFGSNWEMPRKVDL